MAHLDFSRPGGVWANEFVPGVAASSSAIDALLARAEAMLIELGA
jgi:hypothetical protein